MKTFKPRSIKLTIYSIKNFIKMSLDTLKLIIKLFLFAYFVFIFTTKVFMSKRVCLNSYTPCLVSDEVQELSQQLNEAQRQLGRLSCQITQTDVSIRGGWCKNISGLNSTHHLTDELLAQAISRLLKKKSVASFGDGPGEYKQIIRSLNEVRKYDAFDGAPYTEETTDNEVKFLDLSVPVYHLPLYDWVISIEVAEHIPQEFEETFINNLTRHAKEGIILSWAVIGQGGRSHVNNKDLLYIKEQLEKRDFKLNEKLSKTLKDAADFEWLKNNLYVYVRSSIYE